MTFDNLAAMQDVYGDDVIFLMGGDLYERPGTRTDAVRDMRRALGQPVGQRDQPFSDVIHRNSLNPKPANARGVKGTLRKHRLSPPIEIWLTTAWSRNLERFRLK